MTKLISEVIYDVRDAKTEEQKIKILQTHRSVGLIQLLKYAFLDKYPKIENIPEYTPDDSPIGFSYSKLFREYRVIPYFFEKREGLQYKKQQEKLRLLLESLHWTEAALLENILTKNTSSFGLTIDTLKRAFAGEFE